MQRRRLPAWRAARWAVFRAQCPAWFDGQLPLVLLFVALSSFGVRAFGQQPEEEPAAADREERVGFYIKIPSPVTTDVYSRIRDAATDIVNRTTQAGKRPVLVFHILPGPNKYGQASDLAKFLSSSALNGATTVAYVPETIDGHTVLLALACEQIMMHDEAMIGNAGKNEHEIGADVRSGYVMIAERRRTVSPDLALAMLDPALELWSVQTNLGRDLVLTSRLEEVRERSTVTAEEILIPAGEPGNFTGAEARDLGFVSFLPTDLAEVAQRLGLPGDSLREDPSLLDDWHPVRVDLRGAITARAVEEAQHTIETQISDGKNFVCLWLDSAGGEPSHSAFLAKYLAGLDPGTVRTVAYIPSEARGDAALIAMACDHIVLQTDAVLGGAGASHFDRTEINDLVEALRELAKAKGRTWSIYAAMIDPAEEVFRYTRTQDGLVQYFGKEELSEQPVPDEWEQGPAITQNGKPLQLDATKAVEIGAATSLVESFGELKAQYGLQDDPTLIEPGWTDRVVRALASPAVSTFLLLIGGAALLAELQVPGVGLGGAISAVCFVLYFWAHFLGGTAGGLEIVMFLCGVVFLLIEMVVLPGFGIFGLAGGLLVLGSVVLASQTFIMPRNDYQFGVLANTLAMISAAGVGMMILGLVMRRYLPHTPLFSEVMLTPPQELEREAIARSESVSYEHLVGSRGTTMSKCTPSGKARFGDEVLAVLSDGEGIDPGVDVEIVEVRGHRVVVRALE